MPGRAVVAFTVVLATSGCATNPTEDTARTSTSPIAARLKAAPAPVTLVGMRAGAVDALLGQPELQRQERQALYQRHDIDGCALDLYLYQERGSGEPKVVWYEVRPIDPALALDREACAWLEQRLGGPTASERRAELTTS
ncbi:MAG: hypothetical protein NZ555_06465 [Geminicoccaceae bacterium]|nr:hypothetical protein [Geminicoccaceae bacterium]MCX8102153.1 hypothetical protein [Geminicoccaceae bacterium]MDW8368984.1 hypothetical protein [Geminicoccaceae bacterium]